MTWIDRLTRSTPSWWGARSESGTAAALGAADWLSLAAAPTFAAMALLTGALGGDALGTMCLSAHHTSPLTGMAAMYLLMSAFHLAPWLRLVASWKAAVGSRSSAVGGRSFTRPRDDGPKKSAEQA